MAERTSVDVELHACRVSAVNHKANWDIVAAVDIEFERSSEEPDPRRVDALRWGSLLPFGVVKPG
jgi:hypothetical protein